jgi:MoxR-like ATPase
MKPSRIKETREQILNINQPVFVWAAPGVGKSQVVAQVAESQDYALQDIRAVLLDPVDLRGLPHIDNDGRAAWGPTDFLPIDGKGILFLDKL